MNHHSLRRLLPTAWLLIALSLLFQPHSYGQAKEQCEYELRDIQVVLQLPCFTTYSISSDTASFRISTPTKGNNKEILFIEIFRAPKQRGTTDEALRESCEPGTIENLKNKGHLCRVRSDIDTPVTHMLARRDEASILFANLALGELPKDLSEQVLEGIQITFENVKPYTENTLEYSN